MKMARMTVDGVSYPLCFSLRVIKQCTDRYGSVEKIGEALDTADSMKALDEAIWLLAAMMAAGERYAKKHDLPAPPALSVDDLYDVSDTNDLAAMKDRIFETITDTSAAEVEAASAGKNAETTQAD